MGTFGADANANGEVTSGMNHEGESTNAASRGGIPRCSDEVGESRGSNGGVCSEATSVTLDFRPSEDYIRRSSDPFCVFVASNQPLCSAETPSEVRTTARNVR
jgi:hypothetical protein